MKKYLIITILLTGFVKIVFAQNVGIGTADPRAKLDVAGDLILQSAELILNDGTTLDLDITTQKFNHYKLTGPTSNFQISGILAAEQDRIITLYNRSGHSLEIYNDYVTADPEKRILTGTGGTFAVYPGGSVTLKYDNVIDKWEITASHYNSLDNFGVSTIPQTAIIISETKPNSLIENAGYTLVGMTYLAKNEYSLNSFAWVGQINKTNSPSPRISHSATWTGEKMIVWGGEYSINTHFNDGKIFSPSNNSWQSMSNSFLAARKKHAAIWTGNKLIIWGGSSSNTKFNDGATYDLITDIWSSISLSGLSPREEPGYVWTGSKMIIWGGATSGSNTFNDGKIYDIQTNSWQSMSQVNAPNGRRRHSAIWTGDKFIVWGGETNNSGATNTGAIYDPISDTWNTLSTQNAPPLGLADHSTIWTGSKMIVFGGYNSAYTITNACYLLDPSDGPNGTWSICSSSNIPTARRQHRAIWTGDKMIIFGGNNEGGLYDGGIYDPVTNSWDENNIYNNLSYVDHSAIWTGEDMIVFGANPAGDVMKKDFKATNALPHYLYKKN